MKCEKGDWIRFFRNGELVIAVVEYRRTAGVLQDVELVAAIGTVDEEDVIEKR